MLHVAMRLKQCCACFSACLHCHKLFYLVMYHRTVLYSVCKFVCLLVTTINLRSQLIYLCRDVHLIVTAVGKSSNKSRTAKLIMAKHLEFSESKN